MKTPATPALGDLGRRLADAMPSITALKVSELGYSNACRHADRISQGKSIAKLRDTDLMQGQQALVIGAGPSLHRYDTAGIIKRSGFHGTIIATDSAMSWCLRNEIIPHLVVTLDPHADRIARWFGKTDLTEEILAKDDYFARQDMDPKFRQNQLEFNRQLIELVDRHGPQMRLAVSSSTSDQVAERALQAGMDLYWWNPMYDDYSHGDSLTQRLLAMNGLPCVNAGGNVGSACWVFAHAILRKKRVGVVGMDFGYYADTPYEQTQYYKEIVALVGTERLSEVFIRITNPHLNREFYTDPAYLAYRNAMLEMTGEAQCETFNCTGGGILFGSSVTWSSLAEFLEGAE